MANRPIFITNDNKKELFKEVNIDFTFYNGFAVTQKAKSIQSLHDNAKKLGYKNILEVSTKSDNKLGWQLSAFNLMVDFDFDKKIKEIQSRNKTPILVGGTGLYIKAALYDYKLSEEKSTNTYDNLTNEELYEELKKLDKDIIIDKDNRRRLIRAINYYKENNESINKNKTNKLLYNVIFIGLTTDRQVLYDKINKRVDEMISQGLLEEVKSFYDKGIKSKPLLNAIGYRELYNYLDGNGTKEEAIEKIKQNSRHYAKRQYTFFNHQLPVVWFETDYNNFNNTIEKVASYIDSN